MCVFVSACVFTQFFALDIYNTLFPLATCTIPAPGVFDVLRNSFFSECSFTLVGRLRTDSLVFETKKYGLDSLAFFSA